MKTNTRHTTKTKPNKSTRTKMLQSGVYTDTLDMALTAAEENLRKLLPGFKLYEISEAFAIHVLTHLSTELLNLNNALRQVSVRA